jgi:hypothetical protein
VRNRPAGEALRQPPARRREKGNEHARQAQPFGFAEKAAPPQPPEPLYSSLAKGPAPSERRKEVETRMRQRGLTPIDDFDRYLAEVTDFWPEDESCDEFLAWLRKLRREGQS